MEAERDQMGSEEDGSIARGERFGCFLEKWERRLLAW